jgi:predicted secreted protein
MFLANANIVLAQKSGGTALLNFTVSSNIITFNRTDNCTLVIKNESTYGQFLQSQCNSLSVNELLNISQESISTFFVSSPGASIFNFRMQKSGTNSCTVNYNCHYERVITDTLLFSDTASPGKINYTVQVTLEDINVLDLSEHMPRIELKDMKLQCNQNETREETLLINNVPSIIDCERKNIIVNFIGNPFSYPYDQYQAKVKSNNLNLTVLNGTAQYTTEKHNYLETHYKNLENATILTIQRKPEEIFHFWLGFIVSFISLLLLVFSQQHDSFKFVLEFIFGIFFLGAFLNSFAQYKILTYISLVYVVLFLAILWVLNRRFRNFASNLFNFLIMKGRRLLNFFLSGLREFCSKLLNLNKASAHNIR